MFRYKLLSMVILAGMLISQAIPPAMAATLCDSAQFVSDLTVPDGSSFTPGTAFTKTWRLLNVGTCTWTTSYSLVWAGGDQMSAPLAVKLPASVPPGKMLDLSVKLTAPSASGHYKGLFKLSNTTATQFGIGSSSSDPFWADINVVDVSAVIYDFVANAPYAQWKSGAGILPFPGASGDSRGYSSQVNNPHLEDDSFDTAPGLLTVPQNKLYGYIQATYPEIQIQSGDKLQTLVNCEFAATGCYVTFRIDYLLPNNVQKTLWTWTEAYDKRFYRASLDLSSLAGQKVRFVFMLLSSGSAYGDRAIWGSPRIIRTGTVQPPAFPATLTPLPPLTPTTTPIAPPPTLQPAGCDRATFVTDVTIQDGTIFTPGAAFTKTWRLKNTGACIWTTAYKLIYYSGEQMSAPTTVNLPWGAAFDQTVDISVNMVAPSAAGKYRGYWILANANGRFFGIGANASNPVWVEINVSGDAPYEEGYKFFSNACSAQWRSGAGALPCPGTDGDSKGFVIAQGFSHLEDGTMGPAPSILMSPENKYNGYIQGVFPTFTVQPGDHFVTVTGCEYGYNCYVTFRLDYMTPNGGVFNFWSWREQNDKKNFTANVDLSPLAGRSIRFILTILATGTASTDHVRWGAPAIVRAGGAPPTITPAPSDWFTYTNPQYGFQFNYPSKAQIVDQSANSIKLNLPFTPGTKLAEKYLQMSVNENVNPCQSPLSATSRPGSPTETIVINGISFLKQMGGDAGMSQLYEWVAYSTLRGSACISMDFMLHSVDAIYPPPPDFDKAAESAVFTQIMSTFAFLPATITPSPTFTPITVPGTVVNSPDIGRLFMIDSMNGWAFGNSTVLRTVDGGVTWYNVGMPNISSLVNGFFQTSNNGWVLATSTEGDAPILFRTTNGGSTWTAYNNIPFNQGYMQFLDDMNGFVLAGQPAGMQKHPVQLYQTSDGGATWTLKYANDPTQPNNTLPFAGHKDGMGFRDTTTGWVGGDIPTDGFVYLYKTTNSGVSWVQQPLPLPSGYESAFITVTAPKFFSANDAVMPVWMTIGSDMRDLFLYVTHDGGATWTPSAAYARNAIDADVASLQDEFSWDWSGFFHVTNDGGATWRQVTSNVNFGDTITAMDFVSPTIGWVLDSDQGGNAALYRTNDGGSTWTTLINNMQPQPLPDLTITGMHIELQNTSCLTSGDSLGVRVWVKNNGQASAGSFIVRVNNVDQIVNGLNPGETTALFFPGYSNPVTAIVDATGTDPESDETNNSLSEMVPVPTPPLPCVTPTITPTITPTPVTLIGPYAVIGIASNDVLNIRSGAGASQPVVGSFAADAINVMRSGATASADNAIWWEVQNPNGGMGWVNSNYLTEYVAHDAFCADTRIPTLINQLKGSMNQSDGNMFAALVGPKHGVAINFWRDLPPVNYTNVTAQSIFSDTTLYDWGTGPAAGPTGTSGTFTQIVQPDLIDVFNSSYQLGCDNRSYADMFPNAWPYTNVHYYSITKPPSSGTAFDWKVWLVGFEYVEGVPYLYGTIHYVWEP